MVAAQRIEVPLRRGQNNLVAPRGAAGWMNELKAVLLHIGIRRQWTRQPSCSPAQLRLVAAFLGYASVNTTILLPSLAGWSCQPHLLRRPMQQISLSPVLCLLCYRRGCALTRSRKFCVATNRTVYHFAILHAACPATAVQNLLRYLPPLLLGWQNTLLCPVYVEIRFNISTLRYIEIGWNMDVERCWNPLKQVEIDRLKDVENLWQTVERMLKALLKGRRLLEIQLKDVERMSKWGWKTV